MLKTKCFY